MSRPTPRSNDELRQSDGLFLPFVFPGFLYPFNFGPVELEMDGAWGSVTDVLLGTGVGPFGLIDVVTLALVVTSILALSSAGRPAARPLAGTAIGLGVAHVVVIVNSAVFSASGYSENGTYAIAAAVVAVGVALAWWPARAQARAANPAQPAAAGAPADPARSPRFVVQGATGTSEWLTWDQLVWMAQNGQLQPTVSVYDGMQQVTTPAGSIPGLFPR